MTGYEVRYKESGAPDSPAAGTDPSTGWVTQAHGGTGRTAAITDLSNGTSYDVQVRATDGDTGYGAWSDTRSSTLQTGVPQTGATPAVSLSASPNPVAEGSPVTVTVRLSAALSAGVTIPLTVTSGTAEAGDHGTLASIGIDAGSTAGAGTVTTAQDADADDETFTVALGALPASVTAGSPASVEVTITDADGGGPGGGGEADPPVLGADEKAHVDKVGTALLGLGAQ